MIIKLLVVQGRPAGKQLYFGPGEYYLGRGPECQVRFNTDWVSRQHCLLRVETERALLRDLSRNGTLVNGELISGDRLLLHGDQVQIGPVVFEVELMPQAPIPLSPPSDPFLAGPSSADSVGDPAQESTVQRSGGPPPPPPPEE